MENTHYYINSLSRWKEYIEGFDKAVKPEFSWRWSSDLIRVPFTKPTRGLFRKSVERVTCVPLLLYGDGEHFYEFFTKQYCGTRVSPSKRFENVKEYHYRESDGYEHRARYTGIEDGIYISPRFSFTESTSLVTMFEARLNSNIKECSASEFLAVVNGVKEHIAQEGISEQALKERITEIILDVHETARRVKAAEKRKEEKEEAAQRALKEMLK